jgi:RHS repeat-associated protein
MKTKLTLALVALITSSAFAGIPKVLPEFKNAEQLAEWRAEMAAKAESNPSKLDVRSSALNVPSASYTGKPYIESTGSYAFKYRSYNPELARWMSEDPSGFPDGANGNVYAPNPTCEFDFQGLETQAAYREFTLDIFGTNVAGRWDGNYVWSFAEGQETARITPETANDGFTGFTGIPLTVEIGGVNLGIGFRIDAIYNNTSSLTTEMRNGIQWKRYDVQLEVKFKKTLTIGVDVTSEWMTPINFSKLGHWYE